MRRPLFASLALLALAAGCSKPKGATPARVPTTADSADQVMFGMNMILTDRGVQRAELKADTGYFFDENTRFELRMVNTTFFNKDGSRSGVLTSKRGTYNTRANVMEARQNVVIIGADGKRLSSPMVRFEQFRNIIVSDSPFVLVEGERRTEGVGFESDPQMLNVKVRQLSRASGVRIVLPTGPSDAAAFRNESARPQAPLVPPSAGLPTPGTVKP